MHKNTPSCIHSAHILLVTIDDEFLRLVYSAYRPCNAQLGCCVGCAWLQEHKQYLLYTPLHVCVSTHDDHCAQLRLSTLDSISIGCNELMIILPYCYRNECLKQKKVGQMDQFHLALLIRNLMIMLLTDWGHDVAVFDPDAFILKDPMEMYQMIVQETQAHVIGQLGNMPRGLKSKWGFTLCAGAMYYHSLPPLSKYTATIIMCVISLAHYTLSAPGA